MMTNDAPLIDSNILLYSANQDSPFYQEAIKVLEQYIKSGLYVADINLIEFFQVITDGRKTAEPYSPKKASEFIYRFTEIPSVHVLRSRTLQEILTNETSRQDIANFNITRFGIYDYLIADCMRNNQISTIITLNIKDFKKFDFIQAVDPFAALRTSDPAPRPPASGHITYSRQSITEREVAAVCSVLRSDRLTQGPKVTEFEQALAARCEAKHAVAVANGTMALHLACMALNVQPGDTGLTSPISFLASANCLVSCGATPTFADIDPKTLCLSPERVEQYCKANTIPKVVIPVDFAGIPADLSRFKDLAEQYGFWLIEDAAHSLGSTYTNNGRSYPCGSCAHTHLAILSFHPVKSVTSGEGGAVLTNDDRLAMTLRKLVNHGVERTPTAWNVSEANLSSHDLSKPPPTWYHEMQILGYNARITDIHCALGLSQLSRLNRFKKRRQEIVTIYNQNLMSLAGSGKVVLPPWPAGSSPCQHLYPLRLGPEARITRDQLFEKMQKQDIYCQLHYMPIYRQPFYRKHFPHNPQQFPEAEHYFQNALSLPLFADLDNDSIERVLETIHAAV